MSLRVLHVMNELRPSGMERMLISGASYFVQSGVQSFVIAQGDSHPYREAIEAAGYSVITVPPLNSLRGLRAYFDAIRSARPSIVHIHSEGGYKFAAPAARLAGVRARVVRSVHNVFRPTGSRAITRRAERILVDPCVSAIIAVSPDVAENEVRFSRRCVTISNWVDDRYFDIPRDPDPTPSVVMVGNASAVKNQGLVLRAIRETPIALYYHGDERDASVEERELLDELEAAGRLRYRGTGDPARSLSRATYFAMPSLHEGMPIALAEALASRIPILISDAPGMSWARSYEDVSVLDFSEQSWRAALMSEAPSSPNRIKAREELSARAAVSAYVELYRQCAVTAASPG